MVSAVKVDFINSLDHGTPFTRCASGLWENSKLWNAVGKAELEGVITVLYSKMYLR